MYSDHEQILELQKRVDQLEQLLERLLQLQVPASHVDSYAEQAPPPAQAQLPSVLQAPVRVVGQDGRVLLTIEESPHDLSLKLYNAAGHVAASLGVDGTHAGYLAIRNADSKLVGFFDVELSGARLQVNDHNDDGGVIIFGGDSGEDLGGGINIAHTGRTLSMDLWSTRTGGKLTIYNEADQVVLQLPANEEPR